MPELRYIIERGEYILTIIPCMMLSLSPHTLNRIELAMVFWEQVYNLSLMRNLSTLDIFFRI